MAETPGFWMHETGGTLKPAVEAYLFGQLMTPAHIEAMREYLRQWIAADWRGPGIPELRAGIDGLTSRASIDRWLHLAADRDIDPL
jgi:hypothetical protein